MCTGFPLSSSFLLFIVRRRDSPPAREEGQSHAQIVVWEGIQRSLLTLVCLIFFPGGEEDIVSSQLPGGDGYCARSADNSWGVVSGPAKPDKQV